MWFCQGNGWGQYGMTVLPLLAVSVIEMKRWRMKKLFILVAFLIIIGFISKARFAFEMQNYKNPFIISYKQFLRDSKYVDYNSFVAYNCDPNFYLADDIRPAAPFFSLQDFAIGRNEHLREVVVNSFKEKCPQWILLKYEDKNEVAIHNILHQYYNIVKEDKKNKLTLYRYNDHN
jgi:hypothetical protein